MKKVNMKYWGKLLLLGSTLLVVGAGSALAAPVSSSVQIAAAAEGGLVNKQAEIDEYVAGAGQEELAGQGFAVTHTGVVGDKVEVGITPYDEVHADFLYAKFGSESVQVIEGEQAVVFQAAVAEEETADEDVLTQKQREIDDYVAGAGQEELAEQGFTVTHTGVVGDKVEVGITPYNEQHAEFLYKKFGRDSVQVVEGEQAILYGAKTAEADVVPAEEAGMNLWIWIGAAVVIAAGGLLIARKKLFPRS